mgnify:CR=1 FL=1
MLLKKWSDIPEFMKNDEVKRYYDMLSKKRCSLFVKRLFDIIMSFLLCILLSPVLLIIAIWIKIDSNGPIFYRQERITQYGRTFKIFKFRTMVVNADQIGALVTTQNDCRITRVGKKIRKCRLDEIPQVFNILMGDMSFVGTRPEVQKYVDVYTDEMKATLLLPAGVTSLASIHYKNEDEIIKQGTDNGKSVDQTYIENVLPEKMKFNLEYLNHFNIVKDVTLCMRTVI